MEPRFWLLLVVVLIVAAIAVEAYLRRGKHRPLSHQFKERGTAPKGKPPLGMEATNITGFDYAVRVNQNLARDTGSRLGNNGSQLAARSVAPAAMPEDETYAARYLDLRGMTEKDQSR
jgi:hypothetical protein